MIPHFGDKYDAEALFSPDDALAAYGDGLPEGMPSAIILGFQTELHEAVRECADEPQSIIGSQKFYPLSDTVGFVPVNEYGVGAPIAATVTENVIAAGAETVLLLGGCAALDPEITPETAILPTQAIRDEGVSYHYLPPDTPATATPGLVECLDEVFTAANFSKRLADFLSLSVCECWHN